MSLKASFDAQPAPGLSADQVCAVQALQVQLAAGEAAVGRVPPPGGGQQREHVEPLEANVRGEPALGRIRARQRVAQRRRVLGRFVEHAVVKARAQLVDAELFRVRDERRGDRVQSVAEQRHRAAGEAARQGAFALGDGAALEGELAVQVVEP